MHDAGRTLPSRGARWALTVGALGVVFGDIGTSPLYTVKECLAHLPSGASHELGVLGSLSLLFWALVLIVSVKYLGCVTQADNEGEGGIFALLALLPAARGERAASRLPATVVMILIGAALLYGDGIITPAISVLGAAEGFVEISPRLAPFAVPTAAAILAALFYFQRKGTMRIGDVFGRVMLLWFVVLGLLGALAIARTPAVLRALDPRLGFVLLAQAPRESIALLGAVVLVFTGAEALYADLGHFGRSAIARAWYAAAFPGLVLNYFGQGACVLGQPAAAANPFFALAPPGVPRAALTVLAFVAAVIASQALISGCFSLTRQAIQLGFLPRLKITHTHADFAGQIYLPFVNLLLALCAIATVLLFRSTGRLAAAYGIAVTGTMTVTTIAYYLVARHLWPRRRRWLTPLCAIFLVVDLAFLGANAHKLIEGGWFPLAIAGGVFVVMHTWKLGRAEIFRRVYGEPLTEAMLLELVASSQIARVKGAGVFLAGAPTGTPIALLHHVKANRSLHETVVLLSAVTEEAPAVPDAERLRLTAIGKGIWRAVGRYGYMETPDAGRLMEQLRDRGVPIKPSAAVYFFNREMIIGGGNSAMWEWQKSLYGFLSRNARPARDYFQLPPSQIIEIGLPLQL